MSGIPAWAVPGAKVVCVDTSPGHLCGMELSDYSTILPKGIVYEIISVSAPFIRLKGVPSGHLWSRFRPAVERKTEAHDSEFFRRWLTVPHSTATSREFSDA